MIANCTAKAEVDCKPAGPEALKFSGVPYGPALGPPAAVAAGLPVRPTVERIPPPESLGLTSWSAGDVAPARSGAAATSQAGNPVESGGPTRTSESESDNSELFSKVGESSGLPLSSAAWHSLCRPAQARAAHTAVDPALGPWCCSSSHVVSESAESESAVLNTQASESPAQNLGGHCGIMTTRR